MFVALGIQYAVRMCQKYGTACLAEKKVVEHKMCVFISSTASVCNIFHFPF
jgi:hypothetical protein